MDYPHQILAPTDPYDHGFVAGYADVSLGHPVDVDLVAYVTDFREGYLAGRRAHALMHVDPNATG